MGCTDAYALQHSDLNGFLFADVGVEASGMALSVLSALARLGMDPWQEAGRLATLPRSAAVDGLARIIADMPASHWSLPDATSIAARLVTLLPSRGGGSSAGPAIRRAKAATLAARLMPPANSRPPARPASRMSGQWAIVLVLLGAVLVKLTLSLTGQPAVAPNAATHVAMSQPASPNPPPVGHVPAGE